MVDAAGAPVLAVLTRAPSSGGKSRLFASLDMPPDPRLLAALLLDTLDGAATPGVRQVVAVAPASACDDVRAIVGDVEVMAQPDGDLGQRMRATMTALFARGAPAVGLIGSDLPHITASTIAEAFALVVRDPDALVLGPAADGGYYLVAAQRVPDIFSGIEWGSGDVLAQTERAAAARQFHVHRLATVADVDTAGDLRRAAHSGRAPRTAAWLRTYAPSLFRPFPEA
jgi:rSAM/selenodomain-associated transferase 1